MRSSLTSFQGCLTHFVRTAPSAANAIDEDRQEEGRGLAGARLGASHEVPLGLHDWDGVLLDGRRLLVSRLGDILQEDIAKIGLLEGFDLLRRILPRNFGANFVKSIKIDSRSNSRLEEFLLLHFLGNVDLRSGAIIPRNGPRFVLIRAIRRDVSLLLANPASLSLGAVLAGVPLLLAVEALHGTPWVIGAALRIGVDVGVAILGGAAAAAPGIGSGGVVSPRIVVRHLRACFDIRFLAGTNEESRFPPFL